MTERTYLAMDLKSFYASVECMERCQPNGIKNLPCGVPLDVGIWDHRPGEDIRGGTESQGSKSQTAAQRAGI